MSDQTETRVVIVVPNWGDLDAPYLAGSIEGVERELRKVLLEKLRDLPPERMAAVRFRVDYLASNTPVPRGLDIAPEKLRRVLVCGLVMEDRQAAEMLALSMSAVYGAESGIGADLAVCAADTVERDRFWTHWCPTEAPFGLFGNRAGALRAMGGLPPQGSGPVNIVFVDTGLPAARLPPGPFKGWDVTVTDAGGNTTVRRPGTPLTDHGAMVARNALALAPGVRALDCPAIPDGIMNLPVFLGMIVGAINSVKATVTALQDDADPAQPPQAWVICNAWGVFNPSRELPSEPYSNNPGHPLAVAYRELAQRGADIVFAAGNCGEFCPNHRCGPGFIGPGRSIHGINAMEDVLTVGAIRSDGLWLGYSAQGPGIAGFAERKPDLCAPSQFEDGEGFGPNTGTSAACGLAAGAVALLRTRWSPAAVDPPTLREKLRVTAVQPYGPEGWQNRTGHGVIHPGKADEALEAE